MILPKFWKPSQDYNAKGNNKGQLHRTTALPQGPLHPLSWIEIFAQQNKDPSPSIFGTSINCQQMHPICLQNVHVNIWL